MPTQTLYTGAQFSSLEDKALEAASDIAGDHPGSVLYLASQDHPQSVTRDRWNTRGQAASLTIDTLDGFVSDCYERDQSKGRVTHIDRALLFRLVELGVEGIESPQNPFGATDRFPRSGLVDEAEKLFTELEFAGLLSPEAMRSRLADEGLEDRADHVAELATAIEAVREALLADRLPDTYRTERMHHVTMMDTALDDLFPSVEAVVLGGFTRVDALERDLLEAIVDTWPTVALLPKQVETDSATGIDKSISDALEMYRELGFSPTNLPDHPDTSITARRRVIANLYRHPEESPSVEDIDPTALQLEYVECDTIPDEVRATARDIRSQLGGGFTGTTVLADTIQVWYRSVRVHR